MRDLPLEPFLGCSSEVRLVGSVRVSPCAGVRLEVSPGVCVSEEIDVGPEPALSEKLLVASWLLLQLVKQHEAKSSGDQCARSVSLGRGHEASLLG